MLYEGCDFFSIFFFCISHASNHRMNDYLGVVFEKGRFQNEKKKIEIQNCNCVFSKIFIEGLVRGETGARDLSANVGRHLSAGRSSGGDISADREDSPLQSKRSSMCNKYKLKKLSKSHENETFAI